MSPIGQPSFISEFTTVVDTFRDEGTQDAYAALIAMAAAHIDEPGRNMLNALGDVSSTLEIHGSTARMADQIFNDIQRVIRGEPISVVGIEKKPNP